MARFNVYDPLLIQDSYEEEAAQRVGQRAPKVDEIPPISKEAIESLTYRRGVQLLRDMKIKTDQMKTLEDIKCFLRLRYFSNKENNTSFFADIERQIQAARQRQEALLESAELMERQLVRLEYPGVAEIISELEDGIFEGWVANLAALKRKLRVRDTAILITGETGAGKSSLINLLIGKQLLPSAEHPCTAAICTIRNSERSVVRLHASLSDAEGQGPPEMVEYEIDAKELWMESVSNRQSVDSNRRVEFYCPIPLLKENAYFVDSPGFREGPTLTNVLAEFLPEAAAFIVVLMTDNCTGFNTSVESFITDILKTIQNRAFMNKAQSNANGAMGNMSVDNVIFVFNRWDKVVDEMEPEAVEKLRHTCLEKLRKFWPKVTEDHNVFFMSVSKIDSMMSQKACGPEVFTKFQKALFGMIPRSIDSLVKTAYEWMLSVSLAFIDSTRLRLNNARKSKEKKDDETEKLKNLMKNLRETFDSRSRALKADIAEREKKLKNELLEHLKSEDARKRMCETDNDCENYKVENSDSETLLPKAESFKDIKGQLNLFTQRRIQLEITHWNQKDAFVENSETHFPELHSELTRFSVFMKSIRDVCYETFSVFEKQVRIMDNILAMENLIGANQSDSDDPKQGFLNNLEKVFFGVTAIIWIPLLVVGGTISLPFAAGIFMNDNWNSRRKLEQYNKKRGEFAKAYLEDFLNKELKEQVLAIFLYEVLSYSEAIQQRVGNYMEMYSQSIQHQVNVLTRDWRSLEEIQKLFNPVLDDVKIVLNHLYYFHGREMKVYEFQNEKFDYFEKRTLISEGSFSIIYGAYSRSKNEDVAIKLMREVISDSNALEIFTEEKAWRKLCHTHHKNFVYLYGMFFDKQTYKIGFVMEKCDMTLTQFLKNSTDYVPCKQERSDAVDQAFQRMLSLAHQVTKALYFVHANNYVHRDLRLGNVLVLLRDDEVIIKLCDFGWSKSQNDITHSIPRKGQFDIYSSPEIWETEGTTTAADIYSLGLLLWEMYHAEHITAYIAVPNLQMLFSRDQPSLIPFQEDVDCQMPAYYMQLLKECTSFKTISRPSIDEVHARIERFIK